MASDDDKKMTKDKESTGKTTDTGDNRGLAALILWVIPMVLLVACMILWYLWTDCKSQLSGQ